MFDTLTDKLNGVFRSLAGRGKLSEENIREAMRDVRVALLEADVNLKVVNDFVAHVTEKAIGQEVIKSLQPGQLMVKLCYDELVGLMGPVDTKIHLVEPGPTVVMMCGLQGSGKTTSTGKLAMLLKSRGHHPMVAAIDLQRPAAVQQLRVIAEQAGVPIYADESKIAPHGQVQKGAAVAVAKAAVAEARKQGRDILILDTAGRLAIDEELMQELKDVNTAVTPHQIFLVLDSMTGQDAVESAKRFNEQLELDGLILTKLDSDTRGGALLSAKVVTGKPIKFLGIGEKLDRLEEFRPEGMAQRILGMGDVLGLVNEAMEKFDQDEAERLNARLSKGQFTLDDFVAQMNQVKKLGPMSKVLGMLPGMGDLTKSAGLGGEQVEGMMKRLKAIYDSMTLEERKTPDKLDAYRRRRIATGSGTQTTDVSMMIKQFTQARDMMRAVGGMGLMSRMKLMKSMTGGGGGSMANMPGAGNPFNVKKGGWQEKKDRNKKRR